jgi:carbon monoxide dehydrogenase subunit G
MILQFSVIQNLSKVFQSLSEPEKFVSVHPLIFKMDALGDAHYRVYERVKLGFIPYHFSYRAEISHNGKDEVSISAVVFRITKLHLHFKLSENGEGTNIMERAEVSGPFPVKHIMHRVLATQHELMFKNIEKI